MPIWTDRPPMLEIGGDRFANIGGQWKEALAPTFSAHAQLSTIPIDVVQHQPDDLAGSQPEPRQKQ
ncbi:hypothetical protein PTKU46_82210 [Paraburkholderia terrae]